MRRIIIIFVLISILFVFITAGRGRKPSRSIMPARKKTAFIRL